MPQLRDIMVHVTDFDGNDLEEWGTQRLRSQEKISTYITSRTDMPFRVSVQAKIPYIVDDVTLTNKFLTWHDRYGSDDEYLNRGKSPERRHRKNSHSLSSPLRSRTDSGAFVSPKFDFLASLYVDGRKKPERRTIVYLDPRDEDFNAPDGKVRFKSRWVQGPDGSMKEHAWVFKDVGIEASFDKLLISKGGDLASSVDKSDEDLVVQSMNSAALGAEADSVNEEKSNIGQILVKIQRVILGKTRRERHYHSKHREGENDDVDMEGLKKEITHTTGLTHVGTLSSQAIKVVDYLPFLEEEGIYATFQFFYRSQESLERFNFPGFPQAPRKQIRNRRQLDLDMSNRTPLSISYAKQPATKHSKRKGKAFEEHIEEDHSVRDKKLRFVFDDEYRDSTSAAALTDPVHPKLQEFLPEDISLKSSDPMLSSLSQPENTKPQLMDRDKKKVNCSSTLSSPPSLDSTLSTTSPDSPLSELDTPYVRKLDKQPNPIILSSSPVHAIKSSIRSFENTGAKSITPLFKKLPTINEDKEAFCKLRIDNRELDPSSDADDERDESDIEADVDENKENNGDLDLEILPSQVKDDGGLHERFEGVFITSKKRQYSEKQVDDEEEEKEGAEGGEESQTNRGEDTVVGAGTSQPRQGYYIMSLEERREWDKSRIHGPWRKEELNRFTVEHAIEAKAKEAERQQQSKRLRKL